MSIPFSNDRMSMIVASGQYSQKVSLNQDEIVNWENFNHISILEKNRGIENPLCIQLFHELRTHDTIKDLSRGFWTEPSPAEKHDYY